LRLGMMNPTYLKSFSSELTPLLSDSRIYNFVHMPIQSGSEKILALMKRDYTISVVLEILRNLRENVSDLTFSTDIIVGFPNESDQDFLATRQLIRQISPSILNISRFGTRPFTSASAFKNQIPDRIKKSRSRELAKDFLSILKGQNEKWLGHEFRVLIIEKARKKGWISRASNYLQVILSEGQPGEFKDVKIVETGLTYLVGEPI
ncbi:MAG: radical SAM protein, partial [Promethearchaeota archaeon]